MKLGFPRPHGLELVVTAVHGWSPAQSARSATAQQQCRVRQQRSRSYSSSSSTSLTSVLALSLTASCPDRAVRVFPAAGDAAPERSLNFLPPFLALTLFFMLLALKIVVWRERQSGWTRRGGLLQTVQTYNNIIYIYTITE